MDTILAIDDKLDNLVVVKALLKNLLPDILVLTAQSGEEGLAIAEEKKPDAILLDLIMPGLDGYATCRALKASKTTRHIPVIMLTALNTDSESRVKALELGADAFLAKPIEETELVAQLKAMLRIKHAEDILREEKQGLERVIQERTQSLRKELDERKRVEEEREQLLKDLQMKNTELERFSYTVSHDLKSPLVTIKGFLGMLEQDALTGNVEQVRSDVNFISNAVQKMQQLLNELLEFSRIGRLINPTEDIDIVQLIKEAILIVDGRLGKRNVDLKFSGKRPVIQGDRLRLAGVFENLLDNAAKFTEQPPKAQIEVGFRETEHDAAFYVKDNGLGIEPKHHEKIFEIFSQLDSRREGTGIGLSLVKRIVELHGGRIWVESEGDGKGSCFCFTLPVKSRDGEGRNEDPMIRPDRC